VRNPEVFLFDEPLSNLDAKLRVQMRVELHHLHERLQATMIYVTHDQVEAMTLGERIVVMNTGIIQQVGSSMEIYDSPANLFVAGFIGSPAMNFFDIHIRRSDNQLIIDAGHFILSVPSELEKKLAPFLDQKITMGLRPEDLSPIPLKYAPEDPPITTIVDVVEIMGHEKIVYLLVNENLLTFRCSTALGTPMGGQLELWPVLEKLHFFDIETGNRI
jgi:multiple sugar transport system ATP-binding protein